MRRANGSIRFEFNDAVDEGLSFGIPILEVCNKLPIWVTRARSTIKRYPPATCREKTSHNSARQSSV